MTRSLPGVVLTRWASRLQGPASGLNAKLMPRLPSGVKWLLTGGRSVSIDGNTLDRTVQLALAGLRALGYRGLVIDDDPSASRAQMRRLVLGMAGSPDIHVAVDELTIPGPAGEMGARLYRPPGGGPAPLLVYYHGGGYVIGDLDVYDDVCRLVCRDAGIAVLSVDYRLAPEHPAPAGVDDAYAAFCWAHAHAAELGAVPGRVAVGGDSAGGNLAAVVALRARDEGGPAPALQWLVCPVTDLTAQTRSRTLFGAGYVLTKADIDWFTEQYLGGSDVESTDPRVSPLLVDDLSGLAPALVITAGFDPLRDEGQRYAEALRAAGIPVDLRTMGAMIHSFHVFHRLGGGVAAATGEVLSALRAHLNRG